MRNEVRGGLIPAGLLALLLMAGCGDASKSEAVPQPTTEGSTVSFPEGSPQLKSLQSEVIALRPAPARSVNGRIVWNEDRTVRVFSPFAGRVEKIEVQPGDRVGAGQALALIASPDFGQAQSDARSAEGSFRLAEKNLARVRELVANGVSPEKDLNAAEADYSRAQAELARNRARAQLYGGGDAVNQRFSLKSPIAGTVVERNINPGQELRPDQNTQGTPALFVVTDPRYLWAILDVQEEDLAHIRIGDIIQIRSPAYPDDRFDATVTAIADFFDPVSRTIKVRASLDNTQRKLKGEMFVVARLSGDAPKQILVPSRAVFFSDGRNYAFTDEGGGRFVRREIKVGDTDRDLVHVREGLNDGQRVVIDGVLALQQIVAPRRVKN